MLQYAAVLGAEQHRLKRVHSDTLHGSEIDSYPVRAILEDNDISMT